MMPPRPVGVQCSAMRARRSSQASAVPNFSLACGVASSLVRQWMMMGLRASAASFIWAMKAAAGWGLGVFEVVVVEADLADGDAAFVGGQSGQLWQGLRGWRWRPPEDGCRRWRRWRAGGAGGGGGDFEGLMHRGGAFADADGEDGVDARGVGTAKDFVAVVRCRSRGGRGCRLAASCYLKVTSH